MSFHYRHRKIIIICILFFTFCISTFFFYYKNSYKKKNRSRIVQSKKIVKDNNKISVKKENSHNKNIFKVDIKGQIVFPGIYELEEESRVIDQTTPNMIQRIIGIFERKPLISKEI